MVIVGWLVIFLVPISIQGMLRELVWLNVKLERREHSSSGETDVVFVGHALGFHKLLSQSRLQFELSI